MTHASIAKKEPENGDEACSGNGNENHDVTSDRMKSESVRSRPSRPSRKKAAASQPGGRWDERNPEGGRLPRSEPYLTWLGQSLRKSYEETLNEPVPEQFHDLLDRLEQADADKSSI